MIPAATAMNKRVVWIIGGMLLVGILPFIGLPARSRAEHDHGIRLPRSAQHIQRRADGWIASLAGDYAIVTMFEMKTNDLSGFLAQLTIRSRGEPISKVGDPTGSADTNVWPLASTFIPANEQYNGFRRTWSGEAIPVEMFSCSSPVGDWLHVELWKLQGASMLVKMCTDWN